MSNNLRLIWAAAVAAALTLAGCSQSDTAPKTEKERADALNRAISNNSSGSVVSAPADYLGAVVKGHQTAVKTIDASALNSAIQQFFAGEGRFPTNLDELVEKKYIAKIPAPPIGMKFQYDANAGVVTVVKQ